MSNFLHADKKAYCTQHIKKLEWAEMSLAIKFLYGRVLGIF